MWMNILCYNEKEAIDVLASPQANSECPRTILPVALAGLPTVEAALTGRSAALTVLAHFLRPSADVPPAAVQVIVGPLGWARRPSHCDPRNARTPGGSPGSMKLISSPWKYRRDAATSGLTPRHGSSPGDLNPHVSEDDLAHYSPVYRLSEIETETRCHPDPVDLAATRRDSRAHSHNCTLTTPIINEAR